MQTLVPIGLVVKELCCHKINMNTKEKTYYSEDPEINIRKEKYLDENTFLMCTFLFFLRKSEQLISHNPSTHLNLNIVWIFDICTQKWTVPYYGVMVNSEIYTITRSLIMQHPS